MPHARRSIGNWGSFCQQPGRMKAVKPTDGTPCECGHMRLEHRHKTKNCRHVDIRTATRCLCEKFEPRMKIKGR